jgi:membrane protein implicated in regulation of membrane protease activity
MKKISYRPTQVRIFLALLLLLMLLLTFRLVPAKGSPGRWIVMIIESVLVGLLMAAPRAFFPVFKIILIASGFLGNFIFAMLSIFVFYLILTPLALAMKVGGKKFLRHRIDSSLPTYYEEAEERHNIERQF